MPKAQKQKLFQLQDTEIQQILFCDNSDTEDGLELDNEDLQFLEQDVEQIEQNPDIGQSNPEVIIEPALDPSVSAGFSQNQTLDSNHTTSTVTSQPMPNEDICFKWKKIKPNSSNLVQQAFTSTNGSFDYGKILLPLDSEATPYEIFAKVTNFDEFIQDIVIPQSKLYSQQKGHVFHIEEEMKAFFGMTVVMGYHVLPYIRDYWSSEQDLGVPYIANVMTLKRFEEIKAYLHFNDNDLVKPDSDEYHDRAFKVRPVMDHLNSSFMASLAPTQFESVDEHMIKFKGHNILRQYVKGKPIKWGFKMWCRCDSKAGYLFEFDLYTGKKNQVEYGLGEGVVLQLREAIKDLYCKIFIDNFFNSPLLQVKLLERNVFSAGTVRPNRKHLPKPPQLKIPSDKDMKKGDVVAYEANV